MRVCVQLSRNYIRSAESLKTWRSNDGVAMSSRWQCSAVSNWLGCHDIVSRHRQFVATYRMAADGPPGRCVSGRWQASFSAVWPCDVGPPRCVLLITVAQCSRPAIMLPGLQRRRNPAILGSWAAGGPADYTALSARTDSNSLCIDAPGWPMFSGLHTLIY